MIATGRNFNSYRASLMIAILNLELVCISRLYKETPRAFAIFIDFNLIFNCLLLVIFSASFLATYFYDFISHLISYDMCEDINCYLIYLPLSF